MLIYIILLTVGIVLLIESGCWYCIAIASKRYSHLFSGVTKKIVGSLSNMVGDDPRRPLYASTLVYKTAFLVTSRLAALLPQAVGGLKLLLQLIIGSIPFARCVSASVVCHLFTASIAPRVSRRTFCRAHV